MPLLEVVTRRQQRQFCALPHRLHRHEPAYIGPLDNEVDTVFDPAKNQLFTAGGEAQRWLLTDAQGVVIGRIAAFVNPLTATATDPTLPTGGLGFFECMNDQAAANELFDVACNWLKARGMLAVDGPINFGDRDRFWGVLIDGFEREPNYGMFWHPAYYQQLFESYGFQLYFKQYTCYRPVNMLLHPSFHKKLANFSADSHFRFAHARKAEPEKMARDFHHIYNLAWGRHAGVKPMTLDQARNLVKEMMPVLDEDILAFAYHDDEPVAFFLNLPELNQIFKHIGHRLNLIGKLRFVWARWRYMRRTDKKLLGIIYGVVPEFQGTGVDLALITWTQDRFIKVGYQDIEMNWIGDFNPRMLVTTRSIGAKIVKTHATYRKLFVDRPFERYPIIR
ncbi:hypothetical protein E4631_08805 [Hymenobacter sp. UV11]|uniref:hypothetical protein n=1 Tax=Hymenobacter sp. UV11 TaxID=1849735 RepID=UPI00105E7DD6|nr:hypothetical protein [Hymenobacter sp. UV11]TDN36394.1 hypothetical protein A8B98_10510 [Hymenobacter sp. UV11]TFZ67042.1 hypothetical protein E4631_08805 [Hymenobacter sp. UV11]